MIGKTLKTVAAIPFDLLADLDNRDVALWVRHSTTEDIEIGQLVSLILLPWRLVVIESASSALLTRLTQSNSSSDAMTRKRGLVQIIEGDPSRIELPARSLPVYVLSSVDSTESAFQKALRRLTMLEAIRRSSVRQVVVMGAGTDPVPSDFNDLWTAGFRSYLSFVGNNPGIVAPVRAWVEKTDSVAGAQIWIGGATSFASDLTGGCQKFCVWGIA